MTMTVFTRGAQRAVFDPDAPTRWSGDGELVSELGNPLFPLIGDATPIGDATELAIISGCDLIGSDADAAWEPGVVLR